MNKPKYSWSGKYLVTAIIQDGAKVYRVIELEGFPKEDPRTWTFTLREGKRQSVKEEYKETTIKIPGLRVDGEGKSGGDLRILFYMISDVVSRQGDTGGRVVVRQSEIQELLGQIQKLKTADQLGTLVQALLRTMEQVDLSTDVINSLADSEVERLKLLGTYAQRKQYERAIADLQQIMDANAPEQTFQEFLEANVWVFGSGHGELIDKRTLVLGAQQDYILRNTADGYLDVVEIKTTLEGRSPLNADRQFFYPCSTLSKAIGQMARYLRELENERHRILAVNRLDFVRPRGLIVIGRDSTIEHTEALRLLNSHLHHIEVLTYDQLLRIGQRVLEFG
jgi:Domain of unknown function (DUF4263)